MRRVLALVLLLSVSGRGAASQTATLLVPEQPLLQQLTCTQVLVSTFSANWIFGDGFESGDTTAWGGAGSRFPVTAVVDLHLTVRFEGTVSSERLLHVKIKTPRGHLYQTLTTPITSSVGAIGSSRAVEGFPRPLPVSVLAGEEPSATFLFPVAGTSIVSSSLFGHWKVDAFLDDEIEACASSRFELVQ